MGRFSFQLFFKITKSTSINVCGQGHKLIEPMSREEGAHFIGWLSLGADVEIADYECGLLKVDELIQEMDDPGQMLLLGPVHRYDVKIPEGDFSELNEGLTDVVVAVVDNLVLHVNCHTFPWSHTGEVSLEAVQVILLPLLFSRMQPYFLEAKYISLEKCRITLDIINMTSERLHIQGADFEASSFRIHPVTGVVVHGDFLHSLGLSFNLLIDSYLLRVHLVQDVQLLQTAASGQHNIHHSWLVSTDHVNNQRVRLRHSLSLKKDLNHRVELII